MAREFETLERVIGEDPFLMDHYECRRFRRPLDAPDPDAEDEAAWAVLNRAAMAHITYAVEEFETFVEITRTCLTCGARSPLILDDLAEWRRYLAWARTNA